LGERDGIIVLSLARKTAPAKSGGRNLEKNDGGIPD